ncbi:MAG: outer membrane lipid asymmetry maintenance protein MlaD [Ghiorsea sp.]|nr:outer membrane lipid asymmetry maintenance protein MlaD [Ghiorsea sp.]MDQ6980999.1 outer membrane lipid asymmetry maintenance protein MlaD [Ghiorsea sp.]MDQ7057753.1 outer membrane lipid asymmetry maintenance protein MlaD [Ghiorsea sp.]
MSGYKKIEMVVGIFVLVGVMSIAWLAVELGGVGGLGSNGYKVIAIFDDAGGVRTGSDVMLAGVPVGQVISVTLKDNEEAEMVFNIKEGVLIASDATVSIRTKGLIGEKFVRVNQGSEEDYLAEGDEFEDTESAINIEDLISKYIFSGETK